MESLPHLFDNNRRWADRICAANPEFLPALARQQNPQYLWIGCADSRVPANEIVGLLPGELFVHRNIANVVVHTDLNCLSVLQFAVDVLGVRHVIVCGHYGCSGVRAAFQGDRVGLADNWLRHIRDVAARHAAALAALPDDDQRLRRLCELNVLAQVLNVCQTNIVGDAWAAGRPLAIHGWIYGLEDGLLRDLGTTISSPAEVNSVPPAALARLEAP